MSDDQKAMMKRLRRKLEIMLMDNRRNVQMSGDLRECIALTDMMERNDG